MPVGGVAGRKGTANQVIPELAGVFAKNRWAEAVTFWTPVC